MCEAKEKALITADERAAEARARQQQYTTVLQVWGCAGGGCCLCVGGYIYRYEWVACGAAGRVGTCGVGSLVGPRLPSTVAPSSVTQPKPHMGPHMIPTTSR